MKAITRRKYGSSDVLMFEEIEKPIPKNDEVLVKVYASTINSYDWRVLQGKPFVIRFIKGMFKPKDLQLGCDVAGVIEEIGNQVINLKVQDCVYGCLADGNGDNAYAEYVCVKQDILVLKPEDVLFKDAATIPMAGVTALQALKDIPNMKAKAKVLVNGASGGVGMFAVQIAKAYGAEVTAVCSTEKKEDILQIGADKVIDYKKEDFTKKDLKYDIIIDVAANHSFSKYKKVLSENGICVMVGFSTITHMIKVAIAAKKSKNKKKKIVILTAKNSVVKDLVELGNLVKHKKVKPLIDKSFKLEEIADAFDYFGYQHPKGKVVIEVIKE